MPHDEKLIKELHQVYCNLTAMPMSLNMTRLLAWEAFAGRGWSVTDLGMVIKHITAGIRNGERNPGALRFRNLVEDLDHFEEELALAQTASLKKPSSRPKEGGRDRALKGIGRESTVDKALMAAPAKSAGEALGSPSFSDLIAQMRAASDGSKQSL